MTSDSSSGLGVRCRELRHVYRIDGADAVALDGIDLDVAPGQSVAILGPSGSGKSTLLTLLAGLLRPTSGELWVGDQQLTELTERDLLALRGRQVGVVVQNPGRNLLPYGTTEDNIRFAQRAAGRGDGRVLPAPSELLAELDLSDLMGRRVARMSGGEQQRLAVAVAMAMSPGLLLADEPTSQLDAINRDRVVRLLADVSNRIGTTVVAVTHDAAVAAAFERSVTIVEGQVAATQTPRRSAPIVDPSVLYRFQARPAILTADVDTDAGFGVASADSPVVAAPPLASSPPPRRQIAINRIEAIDVSYARAGRTILDRVSITARAGEVLAILGPSGSGKSSLLALLAGLEAPDAGRVRIDGREVGPDVPSGFGLVLQGYGLASVLSAAENVAVALQARGAAVADVRDRTAAVLQRVGLGDVANHLVEELSGGQQQRVAVARALVIEPEVLLADEMTAELDHVSKERIFELVLEVAALGAIVVIATHDLATAQRCHRQLWLSDGRVVAEQ